MKTPVSCFISPLNGIITWDDESKTTILANPRLLLLRCADPGCFCIISNINSSIRIQTRKFFCYS